MGCIRGQETCNPMAPFKHISSHVQPSSCMQADSPVIRPPLGTVNTVSTPPERPTGISSLSGFTATSARTLGFTRPVSV